MTATQGNQGPRGDAGTPGLRGVPGISAGARRAASGLLFLVLVVGGGNLWASWNETHAVGTQLAAFKHKLAAEQAEQARAGALVFTALCSDVGTMAAIKAPPGAAAANPSRAYEQAESRAWRGLVIDLGCHK
jgi:hypothetical protein